jgi:uncharacterized protein
MIVDLITLGNSPREFELRFAPEEIDLGSGDAKLKKAVLVEGTITKHIAQIETEGEINAEIEIDCTRCLQTINQDLKFNFEAIFVTPENYTQAKEAELNAEDLDVSVIEGNEIDLAELVREQILLNLPDQTFCREDCLGLCPKCGANRNLINCNCIEKEIDPRWAGLKNLR